MRTRLKLRTAVFCTVQPMPGALKKGARKDRAQPYQEPALVPLGEKPKV